MLINFKCFNSTSGQPNGEMQLVEESEAPQYVECEEVVVTDENCDVTRDEEEEEYIDVISLEPPAPKPKKRPLSPQVANDPSPCKKPKTSQEGKKFTVLSIIGKNDVTEDPPHKSLQEISEIEKRLGFPDFPTFAQPPVTTATSYGGSVTHNCASLTTSSPKSTQVTQVTGSYSYAHQSMIPWQYLVQSKEKGVALDWGKKKSPNFLGNF